MADIYGIPRKFFLSIDASHARPGQFQFHSMVVGYKNTFISSWRVLKALIMTYFSLWTFLEMEYII